MTGRRKEEQYLVFSFTTTKGTMFHKPRCVFAKNTDRPPRAVYEKDGYCLYRGRMGDWRLRIPRKSTRRLRRFIRDYVKNVGGLPESVRWYTTLF